MSAGWKRASSIKAGDVRGCYVVLARVNGKNLRHPRYTVCCTNCANVREVSSSTLSNQGKGCVSCTIVPGQPRKYADRVAQHIPLYQKWVTKSVNSKRARMSWFGYKEHLPIEALWGSC